MRARKVLAVIAICIAVGALALNIGQTVWPETFGAASDGTHPFAAFCIVFAGVGLVQFKVTRPRSPGHYAAATILLVMLGGIALELLWPWWRALTGAGVCDMVFGPVSPYVTGHIKPSAALILAFIFASALLRRVSIRLGLVFAALAVAEMLSVMVAITLEHAVHTHDIQIGTLLALIPLTLSLLTIYVHRPIGRLMFVVDCISRRTRVLLLTSVLFPWVAGYVIQLEAPQDFSLQHFNAYVIAALILCNIGIVLFTGLVQMRTDVARRRTERLLRLRSQVDELTGMRSRRSGDDVLAARWREYRERGRGAGIILLDFDRFKQLNEAHGPQFGDAVLARLAETFEPLLGRDDMLCRWGGAEFLILVSATSAGDLAVVGERFRCAVEGMDLTGMASDGVPPVVTVSVGMSWFQPADNSVLDALWRADIAMGQAKLMGRNRSVVHHPDLVRQAS